MTDRPILVTGAAGFIGFHVARHLMSEGRAVLGLDNLNPYYDPALKAARLDILRADRRFKFAETDLADRAAIADLFATHRFPTVIHLAAQAGVRYSIDHPYDYADSNLAGFLNILEGCRHHACEHLIFASSSSVYGTSAKLPFSVSDRTDQPISLYAATKRANELMAYSYSHLYRLPVTGLRFFTVYGPWGRPDMAIFLFTKAILEGRPIKLFNQGRMRRDFTYIDDVVLGVCKLAGAVPRSPSGAAPYRLYNIGNHRPEDLRRVVELLEGELGRRAIVEMLPMQPGDVPETFAEIEDLARDTGFRPDTSIEQGIRKFVAWYRAHHNV